MLTSAVTPDASQEEDRVAVVTGGGSGIGAAAAQELAQRGFSVAIVGRRASKLDAAKDAMSSRKPVVAIAADLRDPVAPAAVIEDVLERLGRIDVIVNSAATYNTRKVGEVSLAEFDEHIAVNVRAPFLLVQAALPALRESTAAVVVNVSSAAAVRYEPGYTVYGLTKAALEHLTKNLALELASVGIRVTCIRPGPVATEIHGRVTDDIPAHLAHLSRLVPLGRVADPSEIALWIGHLVDRRSSWVTGAVLSIDGGVVLGAPS
jgi:NAD(P)-dependent dehydrogenase (short-subunit alcohol dehydrogenase family)